MIRLFGNHNSASRTRPGSAFVLYRGMTSIVPQMLQNRSRALAAEERLARAVGRGFIPGIKSALMSAALAAEERLARAVGRGFIPGIKSALMSAALAAEERLARVVGRGFIPGIKSALMSAALAAEVCFPLASPRNSSFSATCLAPKGERQ